LSGMSQSGWKLTAFAPRPVVQDALLAQEEAEDWDHEIVLTGFELADDRPEDWRLDAYFPRKPTRADHALIAGLFAAGAPAFEVEELPDTDWITESQRGIEPITAGRFHVHTADFAPLAGAVNFLIPAGQAFGTGQHATTAGCLSMLSAMKARGVVVRDLADIGTGTGLLAFAAMALWPAARATASDIDRVCAEVVAINAAQNDVRQGSRRGELTMLIADGMAHPLLRVRAPFDLLIANILAGPLVELAADFGRSVRPGGHLLLAGLLETQEPQVRATYLRAGFRLAARQVNGDWSILWLRRRSG